MKALITSLFIFLTYSGWAQTFEIRIVNKGSGTLGIEMRETSGVGTPTTSNYLVDLIFGIRWDSAYGINLNSPSGNYTVAKAGSEQKSGAYEYQAYNISSTPPLFPTDWTEDIWEEVASITSALGGIGSGNFEICPLGFNVNTEPYIDIDITIQVNPSINGSASSVLLGNTIVWDGDQNNNNWFTAANWSSNTVPTQYQGVSIPNSLSFYPILSNDVNINQLSIASSATVSLNGNTLHIRGELSGSGVIQGSSTSELVFSGTSSSTLNMDTTQWDTTNLLDDLTVNLTGGASLTLGSKVGVLGVLTATAGTITTGGHLRICATSASTYGQISPTGSGTISGELTVQKALSNTNAGWRHIGLPVVGTLDAIDSFPVLDSNHSVLAEKNIKYWDAVPVTGNLNPGWTVPDSTFDNTRGYVLYGANGVLAFDQIWSVTGTIATGAQTRDVFYNEPAGSGGSDDNGWNLIANPYASNLDIATMWTTAFTNLSYKAIHIYDQMNDRYFAMTAGGVNIINSGGASDTALSSSVIAPFQAFWVKTGSPTTVNFTDNDRTTDSTGLGTFMKKEYDLARLDVYTADSDWDQTVIYFDENGNPGLDNGLDAYKLFSYDPKRPNLYSVSHDGNFSINALDLNIQTHSVPLGFSSKTGQVSFKLNTADLDAKWFVYLEDKQLGIFYNIKEKPYTFNHTQNSDSRFVLHFQTYGLSAEKLVNDIQNMNISGDGSSVYVFVPAFYKDQNYQLEVIDMAGRVVYTDTKLALNHGMNTLNLNLDANAYYAVRIKAAEGIVSGKVQIR